MSRMNKAKALFTFSYISLALAAAFGAAIFFIRKNPIYMTLLLITAALLLFCSARLFAAANPKRERAAMLVCMSVMLIAYAALLGYFLFFSAYYERTPLAGGDYIAALKKHAEETVSLVPTRNFRIIIAAYNAGTRSIRYVIRNFGGNLLAFAPLALFLPLLAKRTRRFLPFLLCVAGIVVACELLQLVTLSGWCDIDDLLLNTLGAAAAYGLLHIPKIAEFVEGLTLLDYRAK